MEISCVGGVFPRDGERKMHARFAPALVPTKLDLEQRVLTQLGYSRVPNPSIEPHCFSRFTQLLRSYARSGWPATANT